MALIITEDPAVRELGDLIIVGELVGINSSVDERDDTRDSERFERSSDAGPGDRENEAKEDDEADGEEEDDDTESERS